ncbi:hypothetical protein ACI2L1_44995, partial [Streptomyces sp. NPDC019531]|uniref:hypothetical protein n=1 Tax=Streptomyces sp. NPDC019531 TaxID=3365062 RepID=UPI00384DF131
MAPDEHIRVEEAEPVPQAPDTGPLSAQHTASQPGYPDAEDWNAQPHGTGAETGTRSGTAPSGPTSVSAAEFPDHGWNSPGSSEAREVDRPLLTRIYQDPSWEQLSADYEKAIGRLLSEDPRVIQAARKAVASLYRVLLRARGHAAAASAFTTGVPINDPQGFVARLLDERDERMGLTQLMGAFMTAVKSAAAWPELPALREAAAGEWRAAEYDRGGDWYRTMRYQRGYRLTSRPAAAVERLLLAWRALAGGYGGPAGENPLLLAEALLFREALLGWLLPGGQHSMVEVIEASDRARLRDATGPELQAVEAHRLYGWADGTLDPRHRAGRLRPTVRPDLVLRELPHHRAYAARTRWLTPRLTQDVSLSASIARMVGTDIELLTTELTENARPVPGETTLTERRRAFQEWLLRHRWPRFLREVGTAESRALYLVSGADGVLLGTAAANPRNLAVAARSLARDAFDFGDLRFGLPLLLLRDETFAGLVDLSRKIPVDAPDRVARLAETRDRLMDRAAELAAGLADELREHRGVATEALDALPPALQSVWFTRRGQATSGDWAAIAEPGRVIDLPAFYPLTLDRDRALESLSREPAGGRVLWEITNSTARDVSVFARRPGQRPARYPGGAQLRVTHRRTLLDEATGQSFTHVTAEEVVQLSSEVWDRDIVTRPIAHATTGQQVGAAVGTARTIESSTLLFSHLSDKERFYAVEGARKSYVGGPYSVPWRGQSVFFFAAHSDGRAVSVPSRFGRKPVSGEHLGLFLPRLLGGPRIPHGTQIVLTSCSTGGSFGDTAPLAQRVADRSTMVVYAPRSETGIWPLGAAGSEPVVNVTGGNPAASWVRFEPRGAGDGAGSREAVRDFFVHTGGFGGFYGTERWDELTRSYEDALGQALAANPEVLAAARRGVRRLRDLLAIDFPDMDLLLDDRSGAGLPHLMSAFGAAIVHGGTFLSSGPVDKESERYREMRERGLLLVNDRAVFAASVLAAYKQVPGVTEDDVREIVPPVLGWLLPHNRTALFEMVEVMVGTGIGSVVEEALRWGDGAQLYEWADRRFRPRDHAPAELRDRLFPPHRVMYAEHTRWLMLQLTGDDAIPASVVEAL